MKPSAVFQKVHALVEIYRNQLPLRSSPLTQRTGERGPSVTGSDYVADFMLAGQCVLQARWPNRWKVFRLYYCDGAKSKDVCRELGIRKGTFDHWGFCIRIEVGKELQKRDMWPPSRYRMPTNMVEARDELSEQIRENRI